MARKPKTSTPRGTPDGTPPADKRGSMTFRGPEYTRELRTLLTAAAKKTGKTQSALVAELLTSGAQRVLKGEAEPSAGLPPAVISDEITAALASLREDVSGLLAEQQRRTLERHRTLWQRLREALSGR